MLSSPLDLHSRQGCAPESPHSVAVDNDIIIIQERSKAPTLRLKALNNTNIIIYAHIMCVETETVVNLTNGCLYIYIIYTLARV